MKRDMKLVRDLLLVVEDVGELITHNKGLRIQLPGVSDNLVGYHLRLLADGGYLLWLSTGHNAVPSVQGLTWKGHDFLDAMRPKGIWERVVAATSKVGSMTVDVALELGKELLRQQARAAAGLT